MRRGLEFPAAIKESETIQGGALNERAWDFVERKYS